VAGASLATGARVRRSFTAAHRHEWSRVRGGTARQQRMPAASDQVRALGQNRGLSRPFPRTPRDA
jgi:hypothetical protein